MAKYETSSEETITISKKELADVVGIAVQAALAAQAPTPERKRIDAQAQVDEHLASLRPAADMARVKWIACKAPNGATFLARLARRNDGEWRVVQLDDYRDNDVMGRLMPKGLNDGSTGGAPTIQAKEWVKNQYVGNLNRYVTDREPLPVDVEAEAIRAAKANDQAAE